MPNEAQLVKDVEKYNFYTIAFSDEPIDIIMTSINKYDFNQLYQDVEARIQNPASTTRFMDGTISDNIVYEIREQGLFAELILTTDNLSWS